MDFDTLTVKSRNELKDIRGTRVQCEAEIGLKIFNRSVFDGRNYNSHEIEKRLILKNVKIKPINNSDIDEEFTYDHTWIMEDSFNQKNDFRKLTSLINLDDETGICYDQEGKSIKRIKIIFTATVTGYVKNHVYNEFSKKMHSNYDYGLRQIEILDCEIKYKENKKTKEIKKNKFNGVVVKYDNNIFKKSKYQSQKCNPAVVQRLVDIDRQVRVIAESDDDNGIKENELNKLRSEINKIKKKKLADVTEYLDKHKTEQQIQDLIESYHRFF